MAKTEPIVVLYEIRKNGVTCCHSYLENCGYSTATLREMLAAGFELYANGKKVKRGGHGHGK